MSVHDTLINGLVRIDIFSLGHKPHWVIVNEAIRFKLHDSDLRYI
jgi:hypothetical protein